MRHSGLTSDRGCATNGVAYTCDIEPKGYLSEVCMDCLVAFSAPASAWSSLPDSFLPGGSHHLGVMKHITHTNPW